MGGWLTAATIFATVVSAAGVYSQQQAAKRQAEFQAGMARRNAAIAAQNAERIVQEGKTLEDEHRERIAQAKGAAGAVMGANGFLIDDPDSTNANLMADLAAEGAYDILKIADKTEAARRTAMLQGEEFGLQASLMDLKADSYKPGFAATSTLLQGAVSAGVTYKRFGS
jgi:hypothetical protein